MRLKRLLAILIATVLCSSMAAAAAGSVLTNVSVVAQGNSTTVTMRATGPFGHNEYRANDNLLLVDMTGVSAGKLQDRERTFQVPGVESYRIVGYKGMGGTEVARMELRLVPGADVNVSGAKDGVAVVVTPKPGTVAEATPAKAPEAKPVVLAKAAPEAKPAAAKTTEAKPSPAVKPAPAGLAGMAQVQQVSVVRGKDGMEVEVSASTAIKGKVMKLDGPDRLVLDIDNATPAARPKPILVNAGGVKSVRMAQYQAAPPVTRVVVDLTSAQDYELASAGNKLVLKLHSAAVAAAEPKAAAEAAKSAPAVEAPKSGQPAAAKAAPVKAPALKLASVKETAAAVPAPKPPKKAVSVPEVAPASPSEAAAKPAAPVAANAVQASVAKAETEAGAASKPAEKISKGDAEPPAQAQPVVFVEPKYTAKPESQQNPGEGQPSAVAQQPAPGAENPSSAAKPETAKAPQRGVNFALAQREGGSEELVQKPHYTGEPISVNLKDVDLKDFFRLIHEISGLNVVLDPSVTGTLTLVLDDVPWDQALEIVLKNNGLDRQLDGNVLRIATVDNLRKEAQNHRLQVEAQALAVDKVNVTRFLSYAHAKDVLPTVKKLLSTRGDIITDERTNALIIQDIPSVIPEVDRLLVQLDRKTQEVEIEARVVAATRTFARDLGAQVGFGTGNSVFAVGGATAVGTSTVIAPPTNPSYFVNASRQIPLFSNLVPTTPTSGISFSNATNAYRLDLILQAAESRGLLKILSRPRVVTQNNTQALVKQGFRIPVVTLGQLGGPPSVTYIEAVLRLTVTPQITVENTIFLNVDIENTTPDFSRQIMGNPVFLTQQTTTQVLVTDGGTVLIGGVIQTQNSVNVAQVPLLGNIPILGNLFKHNNVQNTTQELIFIITPKIIQT